jgi:hypothetical protein
MAAVGQRHDKGPGAAHLATGVRHHGACAKVHLGGLARGKFQPAGELWGQSGANGGDHAAHARVTAAPAVLTHQGLMDGRTGYALLNPTGHLSAVRL